MYNRLTAIIVFLVLNACNKQDDNRDITKTVDVSIEDINSSVHESSSKADKAIKLDAPVNKKVIEDSDGKGARLNRDLISRIQRILIKANPGYKGQGKLHQENGEIFAGEFPNCGLKDLSPLRGLKLNALDLSGNPVREIRHLRGMPLNRLFLENTMVESLIDLVDANLVELRLNGSPVRSLKGLEGQPLENLYAVGTRISDIKPLKNSQLRQLWLTESPISDFSPLSGLPLISLTAHRTLLEDLSFVRELPLIQRLHIGETLVSDLTPLAGLNLTRLVFSPDRIERGLNTAKSLSNIGEIGTKFDDTGRDLTSPDIFWSQF
jgi:hypothetical protein